MLFTNPPKKTPTNSQNIILGYSINTKTTKNEFSTWNLSTSKITTLNIPELTPYKFPSVCKISKNLYFITGGLINKKDLSSQTWILNTETKKIYATKNSRAACYDSYLIKIGNKILSISGKKSYSELLNNFCYYSFIHMEWFDLPKIPFVVKGIRTVFSDENNDLYVILYPKKLIKFDFKENCWLEKKNFIYDFNKFFITKDNKCLLFNEYHNVVYEYNFYDETIKTKFLLDDMEISDCFYISEADSIVFVDNDDGNMFLVYNCKSENLKYYDSSSYNKYFGVFKWFRTYNNLQIKKNDNKNDFKFNLDNDLDNKCFIFGNFHHPFKLTLDLKNETIKNEFFPENLHLKQEQAVDFYDNNNLLFAGGYDDDVSYHTVSDCYIYNPLTNENKKFAKLSYKLGDCYLQKINIDNKTHHFVISSKNDIQLYEEEKNEWFEIASLGIDDYLPISLGLKDRLMVFYMQNIGQEDQKITFSSYDIKTNKWTEVISKPKTDKVINLKFCREIRENEYLVIENGKELEILTKMTFVKDENNKVIDVTFEEIGDLSMFHIKAYILSYCVIDDIICFMFVNSNFVLNFVGYDLVNNKIVRNEKIQKIEKLVKDCLDEMRLERYLWTFGTFSVIGSTM